MATRFYFVATEAAPITPAFDASWFDVTGALRRMMRTAAQGGKVAATEDRLNVAVTSGAGNETLGFQLISEPLEAQTIATAGTMELVSKGRELAGTDNINQRLLSVRVFSNDGNTLRGTLEAFKNGGGTTELGTTAGGLGQQHMIASDIDADVVCQQGDRLVVEIGYGLNGTGTTPLYDMRIGGNGTDHANANNDATGAVPWFEISQNLTFFTPAGVGPPFRHPLKRRPYHLLRR
jgi:hypothetical protein